MRNAILKELIKSSKNKYKKAITANVGHYRERTGRKWNKPFFNSNTGM